MKAKKIIPIILFALVIAVCIAWIALANFNSYTGNTAVIKVGGKVVQTVDLNQNTTINVQGKNNIMLNIIVNNGEIYVQHSDCPDKICQQKGRISKVNENIICLPSQTVVEVQGDSKEEFDAAI